MQTTRSILLAVVAFSLSPILQAAQPVALPDSPGVALTQDQSSSGPKQAKASAGIINSYETATPLPDSRKPLYALEQMADWLNIPTALVSTEWSQAIDSSPHYGTNDDAFAQRFGAQLANNASQTLLTAGLFAPIFHDDPRYYRMGRAQRNIGKRALYAASRVIITRSNDGRQVANLPLFAGYLATAGLNNTYFPQRDRGLKNTFQNYYVSLAGAAVGFESREFIADALHLIHIGK